MESDWPLKDSEDKDSQILMFSSSFHFCQFQRACHFYMPVCFIAKGQSTIYSNSINLCKPDSFTDYGLPLKSMMNKWQENIFQMDSPLLENNVLSTLKISIFQKKMCSLRVNSFLLSVFSRQLFESHWMILLNVHSITKFIVLDKSINISLISISLQL